MGGHEGVSYISAKWHYLYLFWDLLTIRTDWNRNHKFLTKVFIFYWAFPLFEASFPPFLSFLCHYQEMNFINSYRGNLQTNASSTEVSPPLCFKIWLIGKSSWIIFQDLDEKVTNHCKFEMRSILRKDKKLKFFSIENECFRGNWHFPEESLGNWVWNLCISP